MAEPKNDDRVADFIENRRKWNMGSVTDVSVFNTPKAVGMYVNVYLLACYRPYHFRCQPSTSQTNHHRCYRCVSLYDDQTSGTLIAIYSMKIPHQRLIFLRTIQSGLVDVY